ncbi:uncharacterized protein LOC135819282 [Sycon ciliatum]|uniref:uncharacterized protein LOC135819282 n=1 Tax=Sycon ciliatum TaxID=27933 RepID=UPI0031F69E20
MLKGHTHTQPALEAVWIALLLPVLLRPVQSSRALWSQHRQPHYPYSDDIDARPDTAEYRYVREEYEHETDSSASSVAELLKLLEHFHWHPFEPHFIPNSFARRPIPPWTYDWQRFPAYKFPQNITGMESEASVESDLRYSLLVIDGLHNVLNSSDREEVSLHDQCLVLKLRNPSLVCFVYRQSFHALSNFAWSRLPAENIHTQPYWWVLDDQGGLYNTSLPDYNLWSLMFDWRNSSAQMFYIQDTIGEVLSEYPVVQGVFFDDFDGEGCLRTLNTSLPAHYSAQTISEMYAARLKMYSDVIKLMNKNGMMPILGMSSRFNTTSNGCILPEESVLHNLGDDVGFIREAIFDRPVSQATPQGCSEFMTSTLEEVYSQIPTLFWAHTGPGGNLSSLAIPAFLIVRMEYSYFGSSSGWQDSEWSWHQEYDLKYGIPIEPPQVMDGGMVFSRKYSNCVAVVDCRRLRGCVGFSCQSGDCSIE